MSRIYKGKLGTPRGVKEWRNLETAGDVKRFLAWCIHSVRDQSLDPRTAAILGQLGASLLRTVETTDLETQLQVLQTRIEGLQQNGVIRGGGQWGANRKPA